MSSMPAPILYPDSDGKPMSDNTLHFRWIVTIEGGLDDLFHRRPDVFVAGDLLWYPVEGHPEIRQAPDAMVAFGRPKGLPRLLHAMGRGQRRAAGRLRGAVAGQPGRATWIANSTSTNTTAWRSIMFTTRIG